MYNYEIDNNTKISLKFFVCSTENFVMKLLLKKRYH